MGVLSACLTVLFACLASATPAAGQRETIAFTGASVIDPVTSGVLSNATVVVREGVIVSVTEGGEAAAEVFGLIKSGLDRGNLSELLECDLKKEPFRRLVR